MMQLPISIMPCGTRMEYAAKSLERKGGKLCASLEELPENGYLICGLPFTKDGKTVNMSVSEPPTIPCFLSMLTGSHILVGGNLPDSVTAYCTRKGIEYYDIMTSGDFVAKNARLTAEGLLIPLLAHTSFSVCECRILLIGYGNCGREIADILRLFTNEIHIYDKDPDALRSAESKHFTTISEKDIDGLRQINTIINTSPENPFDSQTWERIPANCRIFNIASCVPKLPFPVSERLVNCPGIPGKYAPKTAGNIIAKNICEHFKL